MQINIGDMFVVKGRIYGRENLIGKTFRIVKRDYRGTYVCKFDKPDITLHNCFGDVPQGYGLFIEIDLIESRCERVVTNVRI